MFAIVVYSCIFYVRSPGRDELKNCATYRGNTAIQAPGRFVKYNTIFCQRFQRYRVMNF